MFLASDKRKLRFYLVTGDKICQLLVPLPPGYVIMVYTSAVQWYGFPSPGHMVRWHILNPLELSVAM